MDQDEGVDSFWPFLQAVFPPSLSLFLSLIDFVYCQLTILACYIKLNADCLNQDLHLGLIL